MCVLRTKKEKKVNNLYVKKNAANHRWVKNLDVPRGRVCVRQYNAAELYLESDSFLPDFCSKKRRKSADFCPHGLNFTSQSNLIFLTLLPNRNFLYRDFSIGRVFFWGKMNFFLVFHFFGFSKSLVRRGRHNKGLLRFWEWAAQRERERGGST